MNSTIDITRYRRGLNRALRPFHRAMPHGSVLKARLLLMMPCKRTMEGMAGELGSCISTIHFGLRALERAGLIRRIREGGLKCGNRYELTPAGEAIFAPGQTPHSAVLTRKPGQRHPAEPADASDGHSGGRSQPPTSARTGGLPGLATEY